MSIQNASVQTKLTKPCSAMKITKLKQHIGAEVTGIDLRQPVDAETRRRLNEAVVENIALVIRDQHFTPAEFLAAARIFGEPMNSNFLKPMLPDVPFVHEISSTLRSKDGTPKKVGTSWHTDHTNCIYPPKYTVLFAVALPPSGGATNVANMRAGYASLPEELKQRITDLKTVNVTVGSAATSNDTDKQKLQKEAPPDPILQPLVRTNGEHGSKALYFHPSKTENIVGMGPEESQALLRDLTERALKPEFIYTHEWKLGDMFLWDNRSALHKANFDYDINDFAHPRRMYRVMITGELPR